MKKVFFVLAFVAVYGASMAMSTASTVISANSNQVVVVENEKGKDEKAGDSKAKTEGSASKEKSGCAGEAKSGCSGEAKKECAASCSDKKK